MSFFQAIRKDIRKRQNFDVYFTVILAALVSILNVFQVVNQEIIASTVLATLALVSANLLVIRRENDEIRESLASPIRYFSPQSDVAQLIHLIPRSHKIWCWGTTFSTHIPLIEGPLTQAVSSNNLEVKFLMVKPSSCAVDMASFRAGPTTTTAKLNATLENNLSILATISNLVATNKLEGNLSVKVVDYLGPYTVYIFDPHLPHGQIHIHLSTFRGTDIFDRPTLILTREESQRWFNYFVEQFEAVWMEGVYYSVPNNAHDASQE